MLRESQANHNNTSKNYHLQSNQQHHEYFRRHAINQSFRINDIVLEMYRRDPSCTEALIHPHLRTLEVNSKTLPLVLEYAYNLTNITTLYLFFDINRYNVAQYSDGDQDFD